MLWKWGQFRNGSKVNKNIGNLQFFRIHIFKLAIYVSNFTFFSYCNRDAKNGRIVEAKLLRATFYILSKQTDKAFTDLEYVIENENADPKMRANALIKRASLYIQRCKDPQQDPLLSFKDFERATQIDPNNADVYHHRGQVSKMTLFIEWSYICTLKKPFV